MIRPCSPVELDLICELINDAATAYKGVIPSDCWKEPYMSREELRHEIEAGVRFWGVYDGQTPLAVMGLQHVRDVALIRHAYTQPAHQRRGHGAALLAHLRAEADRPMLVGTWQAATWAIRFYQQHGFRQVLPAVKRRLLRRYWTVPDRQIEASVVLVDERGQAVALATAGGG